MSRFLADIIGAFYDFVKFLISCLTSFYKGVLIVGIPLFIIAKIFEFIFS